MVRKDNTGTNQAGVNTVSYQTASFGGLNPSELHQVEQAYGHVKTKENQQKGLKKATGESNAEGADSQKQEFEQN